MTELGLRERKKLKTRATIQREAMRLFAAQGYQATTVEQIAAAAEISPSTFFNYFPNKEAVVLQDDLDPPILAAFYAQAAGVGPIAALRAAMREVFGGLGADELAVQRQRMALIMREPDLRAAMLVDIAELVGQVAELLAKRTGRSADDFAVRNLAGAVLGVAMATMLAWSDDPPADLGQLFDRGLAHLEAGLPL